MTRLIIFLTVFLSIYGAMHLLAYLGMRPLLVEREHIRRPVLFFMLLMIAAPVLVRLLERLQCFPLLKGYRGKPGVDMEGLLDLMQKLQRLLLDFPEIEEMDLNPLIWDGNRFIAADYRIKKRS